MVALSLVVVTLVALSGCASLNGGAKTHQITATEVMAIYASPWNATRAELAIEAAGYSITTVTEGEIRALDGDDYARAQAHEGGDWSILLGFRHDAAPMTQAEYEGASQEYWRQVEPLATARLERAEHVLEEPHASLDWWIMYRIA